MRKDRIFQNILNHPILDEKYNVFEDHHKDLKVHDAMLSSNKIVRALAFIVESLETDSTKSEKQIYTQISQLLNESVQ